MTKDFGVTLPACREPLPGLAGLLSQQRVLMDEHGALTGSDLGGRLQQLGDWLQLQRVRVVALLADNQSDWVLVDLACQQAGVICLPLPGFFSAAQLQHCLAEADLLFTDANLTRDEARVWGMTQLSDCPLPDFYLTVWRRWGEPAKVSPMPQGTDKLTFTSGSTGAPKGVCLSREHQWRVARSLAQAIAIERPRHLCLLPLATLLENLAGVYAPLLCGGEILLPSATQRGLSGSNQLNLPAMLQALDYYRPQTLILVPQLLRALLAATRQGWRPPASLQFVAVGGGKVAPLLIERARECGLPVYEGYGLSECGSVVALNTPTADRVGTVGQVLPHCQATIDKGELVVSGSSFLGYLGEPDSWYPQRVRTGDLGQLESGWLTISGRAKHQLISSYGRNISPEWVESQMLVDSPLSQCVVLGEAQPCLVALLGASSAISDQQIEQWLHEANGRLPDYARVQAWQRLSEAQWAPYLTANGRPRREQIANTLAPNIEALYESIQRGT